MERSLLRAYSLGIVLEDKEGESDMIKVSPIEQLSLFKGELSQQKLNYDVKLPDAQGIKREEHIEGGSEIIAKWIFSSGNRITAPNVKKNESVLIYKFADTDEFYWEIFMREPSLRRLEHVNYSFSNLPNGVNPYDKNSSYWYEISTREKYIHLHTAKNNGEPFEYDIKLDTSDGFFEIKDDIENYIKIDSTNRLITLHHTSGHIIEIGDDYIKCEDNTNNIIRINRKEDRIELEHHTDSKMHIDSNKIDILDRNNNNIKIDTLENSITSTTPDGAEFTLNKENITLTCKNFTINSENTVINGSDSVRLNGSNSVRLEGPVVTAGGEDLLIDLT